MSPKRRNLAALLCTLCLGACVAVPASAAAAEPITESATELVFAGETAHSLAGQLGVAVRCLGPSDGFCSGTVTLSGGGRQSTSAFSVQGGAREVLYVPLRLAKANSGVTKVRGIATTDQRLGAPRSIESFLRVD
ncbi:MAG TPA: hypothetical protein VHZ54_04895 [Solirubrobacterales bacterium]|jgi:hypothetical protein|nr:hypothetical protein [Solirubrobacterales bacterium]